MLVLVSPASAAFPGQNGKIAFASDGNVQTIEPDGSGRATVTAGDDPVWNSVGSKIAFADIATTHQVFMINANGTGRVQVTNEYVCNQPPNCYGGLSSPTFSPTGHQIAYTVSQGGHGGSFWWTNVMDIDTGAITGGVSYVSSPAWSPDGSKIAFEGANGGIQVADPDGTNLVELTHDDDTYPSWSPDGSKIAFTHIDFASETYGLYTIDADGSNPTRLTDQLDFDAAWSSDGSKIAFVRNVQTAPNVVAPDLFTMNADGTGQVDITPGTSASEVRPDWQPINPGYARPIATTNSAVRLVPAQRACTDPNATHNGPLAAPSCSPAVQTSDYLTVGGADGQPSAAKFIGSVGFSVIAGDAATFADEADLRINVSLSDVRRRSDHLDYEGELLVSLPLRITDRWNGPSLNQAGTAQDLPLAFPVTCTATTATTVGSTCSISTTADSIAPGAVREGRRAVWELRQVQVYDGGADADADTPGDNTLFAVQGLFAP